MTKEINILIVEDHTLTRIGLKTALEESSFIKVIGESEYGEKGVELAKELNPTLIIMDLGLPNMNGIEATKAIKNYNSEIKIIILTSHEAEDEILGAISAGADAYCLKDISPSRLISIIENVADGGVWLDPSIAKTVLTQIIFCNNEKRHQNKSEKSPLSDREVEVLQLIANGLNNLEIAKQISISQHTVKSHISNIIQKLAVDDRTQAVANALRKGWIN